MCIEDVKDSRLKVYTDYKRMIIFALYQLKYTFKRRLSENNVY